MKLRLMGTTGELDQAVRLLTTVPGLLVVQVDGPYPNRGASHLVRAYLETRLTTATPTPASSGLEIPR